MAKLEPFAFNVAEKEPAQVAHGLTWLLAQNDYLVAGRHRVAPGRAHPPNSHPDEEECFYVLAGTGVAIIGEKEIPVNAGSFIYVPRNTSHSVKNTGCEPLEYLYFGTFVEPGK